MMSRFHSLFLSRPHVLPVLVAVLIIVLFRIEGSAMLLPLFSLCCDGGGGDGGDGGGDGGTGDSDGSDVSGGLGFSTPFLYVWNGERYAMDNDVLYGKPSSRFRDLQEGIKQYQAGRVAHDRYVFAQEPDLSDGTLSIQLKEIEPEQSAIDFIRVKALTHPERITPIVKSDFSGYIGVNTELLNTEKNKIKKCVLHTRNGKRTETVSRRITQEESIQLEVGDSIEYTTKVNSTDDESVYLVLDSWYRDWTLGKMYWRSSVAENKRAIISPYIKIKDAVGRAIKTTSAGVVAAAIGFFGVGHSSTSKTVDSPDVDDLSILASSFGIERAFADNPHDGESDSGGGCNSLVVSYWKNGAYQSADIVLPRYKATTMNAIELPKDALGADGTVSLQIYATKRHRVSGLAVLALSETDSSGLEEQELRCVSASEAGSGEDVYTLIENMQDGQFIYTRPGEAYTMTYKIPAALKQAQKSSSEQKLAFLLEIGGVYAPLSLDEQEKLGNWTEKLDSEALEFLETAYELNAATK